MSNIKNFEDFHLNEYNNGDDKIIQNYEKGVLYLKRALLYLQYSETDFSKTGNVPPMLSEFIDLTETSDFVFGMKDLETEIENLKNYNGTL
jgi:hypothetical protein